MKVQSSIPWLYLDLVNKHKQATVNLWRFAATPLLWKERIQDLHLSLSIYLSIAIYLYIHTLHGNVFVLSRALFLLISNFQFHQQQQNRFSTNPNSTLIFFLFFFILQFRFQFSFWYFLPLYFYSVYGFRCGLFSDNSYFNCDFFSYFFHFIILWFVLLFVWVTTMWIQTASILQILIFYEFIGILIMQYLLIFFVFWYQVINIAAINCYSITDWNK